MLRTLTAFEGISIHALDGAIGAVKDAYFDDKTWTVRSWNERKVLISLTRGAVREAPRWDPSRALTPDYASYLLRFDRENHRGLVEGRQ